MSRRLSFADIVRGAGGDMTGAGRALIPGPGHSADDRSLSLKLAGDGRILWNSFSEADRRNSRAIFEYLERLGAGKGVTFKADPSTIGETDKSALARDLWEASRPIEGTLAARYLAGRAIESPYPASLRFHPAAPDGRVIKRPALIAALTTIDVPGDVRSLQRTFLTRDARKIARDAKKTLGSPKGLTVVLGAIKEAVVVAEGVETALSASTFFGLPAVATLGTSGMESLALPDRVRRVLIAADNDENGAGLKAAEALAVRLESEGRKVEIRHPSDGKDMNDVAQKGGGAARTTARPFGGGAGMRDKPKPARAAPPLRIVSSTPDPKAEPPRAMLQRMSDVRQQPYVWLWRRRIALGKIVLLAGEGGLGKSQIACDMAACVTAEKPWPDGEHGPQGSVLMLSAEDDAADTIKPRLMAAGANCDAIHMLDKCVVEGEEKFFDLAGGLALMEDAARQIPDLRLISVDPVMAYMGASDSHKNQDVRAVLRPYQEFAARRGVAIVLVTHTNKSASPDALDRISGSKAFSQAARAAYIVMRDDEDPDRRLFLPGKANIGGDRSGFAYRIVEEDVPGVGPTPRIEWLEEVNQTATEALAEQAARAKGESQLDKAVQWLRDVLAGGPIQAGDLREKADSAGISWRTIERAKAMIGARTVKERNRPHGRSHWYLP